MSRFHELTAHEKEIAPGTFVRFPFAACPELRRRIGELEDMKSEAYLAGEEQRARGEARRERQALSRGDLRRRYLTPAGGRP